MSGEGARAPTIAVIVVHSPGARSIEQHALTLPVGSTVAQAVAALVSSVAGIVLTSRLRRRSDMFTVGALVMLLRKLSGYPEGVMFAVLIMNALVPLINRWTIPVPVGGPVPAPKS